MAGTGGTWGQALGCGGYWWPRAALRTLLLAVAEPPWCWWDQRAAPALTRDTAPSSSREGSALPAIERGLCQAVRWGEARP